MSISFSSLTEKEQSWNNLLIVDAMPLAMRSKYGSLEDSSRFRAELLSTINSLARSYECKQVVVLSDFKGSRYRKGIDPEYKANRKERYEKQTEEERAAFMQFLKNLKEALEFVRTYFHVLRVEGVEADDLAAYIVDQTKDSFNHVWLISVDGDWDLLLDDNVSRFSTLTRREYTLDNFFEYHNCDSPTQFACIKALQGDTGDNVIGIEGLGVKRAYNLVREYGTAIDIYESIPLPGKQKFIQKVNESGDTIMKNLALVDLVTFCEEAIMCNPEGYEETKEVIRKLLE